MRGRAGVLCFALFLVGTIPFAYAGEGEAEKKEAPWLAEAVAGEPTVKSGLFRVESTEVIQSKGHEVGQATLSFGYLDIDGQPKEAKARLFVRRDMLESGDKIPLAFSAHYEFQPSAGASRCRDGWAALTPHLNPELPLGNSFNLDLALLEWARRLPFIDRTHLLIEGGSAGGYMALAMAAEIFPVIATVADAPVLNWSYNLAYFDKNLALARGDVEAGDPLTVLKAPVPFLAAVGQLAAPLEELFGKDLSAPAYRDLSPIYYFERITCPVSLALSTADVLVPMPQLSTAHFTPPDPGTFADGFEMQLEVLARAPGTKRPFLDILPDDICAVYVHTVPDDFPEIDPAGAIGGKQEKAPGPALDRPYDVSKLWSITILDEGKPTPKSSHLRYSFDQNADSFKAHYQKAALSPEQLTGTKLGRLMERFIGTLSDAPPLRPESESPKAVHRLNYPALERLDVVSGLLDYAGLGDEFAVRLREVYATLPHNLKVWGDALDMSHLRTLQKQLREQAEGVTGEG
jgi:hypothetical protein